MSKCPVESCPSEAKPGQLMCLAHWRLVPKPLQTDVWRTWRALQGRASSTAIAEYREAKDKAIAAAEKESAAAKQGGLF